MKEPRPTRAPRQRRLSDEEIDLWIAVAKSVSRHKGAKLPSPRKIEPPAAASSASAPDAADRKRPPPAPKPASHPPLAPLERRLRRRLAQGRSAIDQSIDLHGMTQAQAH